MAKVRNDLWKGFNSSNTNIKLQTEILPFQSGASYIWPWVKIGGLWYIDSSFYDTVPRDVCGVIAPPGRGGGGIVGPIDPHNPPPGITPPWSSNCPGQPLSIVGPDAFISINDFAAIGGVPPYTWIYPVVSCGPSTLTVVDDCGSRATKSVMMPGSLGRYVMTLLLDASSLGNSTYAWPTGFVMYDPPTAGAPRTNGTRPLSYMAYWCRPNHPCVLGDPNYYNPPSFCYSANGPEVGGMSKYEWVC
jgi:hypothetical protein